MMSFGPFRKAALVAALSALSVTAVAQPAPQPPQTGQLDLPQQVTFVGTQEPNTARPTAIVNDEIITRTDIDQRMALIVASTRVQIPPEEMERLRAQVLRNLIDEALQIQAARENEVTVEPRDVDRYYARFAQQFSHTPQSFGDYLRSIGSSERSVKRQIQGEISWQRVQQRRLVRVSVADGEVQEILNRMNAARGSREYHVLEIYLSSTPETANEVRNNAARIIQQIRGGGSFPAYARQFSEASTAAVGGDLGWLRAEQLPPELAAVVSAMPVGAISDPIQVQGGFSVVALIDARQILVADPRDATMSLMQMAFDLPPGTTEAQARARADLLTSTSQSMGGCGGAATAANRIGAELVSNDNVRVRDLPAPLQPMLLNMSVGQATQVFGTLQRVSVLVLCGRDDPQPVNMPTAATIAERIEEERMNRQAQRYLRDLRRDAVIEYR
jgi:peptidyl-prolyl cis-trans isomerase SurA